MGVFKENIDKVILIDITYGIVCESEYLSEVHVPGAIHPNTNAYERPHSLRM